MAPLLLRHLAASLTRQVSHMRTLSFSSSPAASAFRCLRTLAAAPRALLPSPGKIMGSVRAPLSGSSAPCGPSLLGQCQHLPCIQPSAGMKTKSALKRRCKDCFFARRRGRLFVFCKANPRHKQRQG